MKYVELQFELDPLEPGREILVSDLADLGFESFQNTEKGVSAYIPKQDLDLAQVHSAVQSLSDFCAIQFQTVEHKEENWNEIWESEYETVEVEDRCIVLAPFHKVDPEAHDYQVIINPKMSFGTGHHETTYLMISYLLDTEVGDKDVLDMGSGTGVLAILAAKMKAKSVRAIDIEEWAFENTEENAQLNKVDIHVDKGDSTLIKAGKYDLILANINKNVLLADMHIFANAIHQGGLLYLSGFFQTDVSELTDHARAFGLILEEEKNRNNWAALKLRKE